jgi:hypothetical protein
LTRFWFADRHSHRTAARGLLPRNDDTPLYAANRNNQSAKRKSRGDWTPLELFLGGIAGCDTGLRRRLDERKVEPRSRRGG